MFLSTETRRENLHLVAIYESTRSDVVQRKKNILPVDVVSRFHNSYR